MTTWATFWRDLDDLVSDSVNEAAQASEQIRDLGRGWTMRRNPIRGGLWQARHRRHPRIVALTPALLYERVLAFTLAHPLPAARKKRSAA